MSPPGGRINGPGAAWDEVLDQTSLVEIPGPASPNEQTAPAVRLESGISQLDRYLSRAWSRAGVPLGSREDYTQAVYLAMLQNMGRDRLDRLVSDVGEVGVRDVLSRDTSDGPDFFRAVDTVKKRARRERTFQPIDSIDLSTTAPCEDAPSLWRAALLEAIEQTLTPREAELIHETLLGKTPSEIAIQWCAAPKTVSNKKTLVIQRLRDALVTSQADH
jgi:DNA-binding CsgD family transcriptional regulator